MTELKCSNCGRIFLRKELMLGYATQTPDGKYLCRDCKNSTQTKNPSPIIPVKAEKKPMHLRELFFLAGLYFIFPFFNGWYNQLFQHHLLFFWIFDIAGFVVIPVFIFRRLFRQKIIRIHDRENIEKNGFSIYLVEMIVVPVCFFLLLIFLANQAAKIFPVNYFYVFSYENILSKSGTRAVTAVFFAFTAGIVEELYYRAFLTALFKRITESSFLIALLSGLLFGIVHWENGIQHVASTAVLGFVCSLYYIKSKNILPLITAHILSNLMFFL